MTEKSSKPLIRQPARGELASGSQIKPLAGPFAAARLFVGKES